jgi:hypothetical protein
MNRLEQLRQSLTSMSDEELREKTREVREDRQISKKAITHRVAKKKTTQDKLTLKFTEMSEEDKSAFRKAMGLE